MSYSNIKIVEGSFEAVEKQTRDSLLEQGFGKGANHDNTLVISDKGVVKNKLRFEDEFLRHKI